MPNFITERSIIDKMILNNITYERKIVYYFNEQRYVITWYIYQKGRKIVKDIKLLNNLEASYQQYKDR